MNKELDTQFIVSALFVGTVGAFLEVLLSQVLMPKTLPETYVATFIGLTIISYLIFTEHLRSIIGLFAFVIWKFVFWIFGSVLGIAQLPTLPAPDPSINLVAVAILYAVLIYPIQYIVSFYGGKSIVRR